MATFNSKQKAPIASEPLKNFKGISQHITTCNFMQFQPVYYRHLVKGSKLDVDITSMSRLLAMTQPTFGRVQHHMRAFFVPYRLVFKGYNDFILDTPHTFANGITNVITQNRFFDANAIVAFFVSSRCSVKVTSDVVADFEVSGSESYSGPYVFRPFGRRCYKIFRSLGYQIPFDPNVNDTYDASALLCLARVYMDWFYPSQYVGTPDYNALQGVFDVDLDAQGFRITSTQLGQIFAMFDRVCYESDYFTSAFDNPTGPNNEYQMTSLSGTDVNVKPSADGNFVENNPDGTGTLYPGTPSLKPEGSALDYLTYYSIRLLRQMTVYMKRHQIAGARAMDRFLARYGDIPTSEKILRAQYLGHYDLDLEVRSIESTAATADAALADFAGQGVIRSNGKSGHFHCEADEDGFFVITSSVVPIVQYVQGIDRNNLRRTKLEYFTPEFDGLGTQPIQKKELLMPNFVPSSGNPNDVFGFTPRYAEYKIFKDWLSGDFACDSISQAGDTSKAWHLARLFDKETYQNTYDLLVHSEDFIRGRDAEQYLRIFQTGDEDTDHLVQFFLFSQSIDAPFKALFDTLDFEHEKGRRIDISTNGTRLN